MTSKAVKAIGRAQARQSNPARITGHNFAQQASPPGYPPPPAVATHQAGTLALAIHSQSERLSELGSALDHLESAMSLVLIPVGPEPAPTGNAGTTAPEPAQSPAMHVLHDLERRAEQLIYRINGLASRVQA